MAKLILSFLGLPGSGKSTISERLSKNHGFKFIQEIGTNVIRELKCKVGTEAPFEFDNIVFMRTKQLAQDVLNSKDKKIILEAGPPMAQMYVKARSELGKHKDPRKRLLEAYDHHSINNLMENTVYFYLFMPPQIAINRQEERNKGEMDTMNMDFLHFMHKNLMTFYKSNKDRVVLIDVVGKTEDQVYREVERKVLSLVQKELG